MFTRIPLQQPYVEVSDAAMVTLLDGVAFLLRTADIMPIIGDKAEVTVNANAVNQIANAWKSFPDEVHRAYGHDGVLKDRLDA